MLAIAVAIRSLDPFRRGNGCYYNFGMESSNFLWTFSPLFIAAMVATQLLALEIVDAARFQSPFRRGNGCYWR